MGVEGGVQQAGVDCGDDEVLEGAGRAEAEGGLQGRVRQVGAVAREGQEGELAELEGLGVVERGEVRRRAVDSVGAVGEELKEGEVGEELWAAGESLDLGRREELGKEEGVRVGGRAGYQVGGGAGGCGGFAEGQEGLVVFCQL